MNTGGASSNDSAGTASPIHVQVSATDTAAALFGMNTLMPGPWRC